MLRLIYPGALPSDYLQRFFHPSMDRLLQLIEVRPGLKNDTLARRGEEFSGILRHIRIGTVWKCTNRNRLEEADRALCSELSREHRQNVRLLDVGGSDGITTLDLVNKLEKNLNLKVEAYLADRYLVLLRFQRGFMVEYASTDGQPVLVQCGPVGLFLGPSAGLKGVFRYLEKKLTEPLVTGYLNLRKFRSHMRLTARIPLVNPVVLAKANIKSIEMDIFKSHLDLRERMDVVRVCNVLTLAYYSETQIAQAVDILYHYLRPGGFLLISRNHLESGAEKERGSIWRKKDNRFVHVVDFGGGSEIKRIIQYYHTHSDGIMVSRQPTNINADNPQSQVRS